MQSIEMYVNAESALGVVRDAANAKTVSPPTLVRGARYRLKLRLFAGSDTDETVPLTAFAAVASWSWSMDTDYNLDTNCKIIGSAAQITATTVDGFTEIAIPMLATDTEELATALGSSNSVVLNGELCGYDSEANLIFILQIEGFKIRNRIAGSGTATQVDSGYITATQAAAMLGARQNAASYSSGAEVYLPGKVSEYLACISGGVTASAAPDFASTSVGGSIVDGTVTWEKKAIGITTIINSGGTCSGCALSACIGVTDSDGFYVIDSAGNIIMRVDSNGLDAAKLNAHFTALISSGGTTA